MNAFQEAMRLAKTGRFLEASQALNGGPIDRAHRGDEAILRAELLERLGLLDQARARASELLKSRGLTPGQRSACHLVLARAEAENRQFDSAIAHLQRAIADASSGADQERVCWAQMRLLAEISEQSGPDAASALIADVHANATRSGNPTLVAALHVFVGQTEAKRCLLSSAHRHLRIALNLLARSPNEWLEGLAEQTEVAIAIMRADARGGRRHAERALECAERSGVSVLIAAAQGNLANLLLMTGDYERAYELQERALAALPPKSDNHALAIDTLACIRLAQGRLDECRTLLDQIVELTSPDEVRARYAYRHTLLTRVQALAREKQFIEARKLSESAILLAEASGDVLLFHLAVLSKADVVARTGDEADLVDALAPISATVATQPPHVYALYEQVIASGLARLSRQDAASAHASRARRTFETLQHIPRLHELNAAFEDAAPLHPRMVSTSAPDQSSDADASSVARTCQGVAALVAYQDRPELLARELSQLLMESGCASATRAVLRKADGRADTLWSAEGARDARTVERCLAIGPYEDGVLELAIVARTDLESTATMNAIALLRTVVHDLARARVEREEQATLWPVEELPADGPHGIISGHMREQMDLARKIARTNVNVLITGESGTGKEIIAHAIHDFSNRADKPFVPFNCSAIPHDLLESQLFGHRRGAFTGADRDHAGVIRTARNGTLFFDEIGDLSLTLQPKLLRFLECGEIAPIGEPSQTVDVRIVAATNSNLEDAVTAGRFRDDLFYRLNVVRLSLKPLRERRDEIPGMVRYFIDRASEEFQKGHLRIPDETMERLTLYRWPGNVRQLQNLARRMVALVEPSATLAPEAVSNELLGMLPPLEAAVNGKHIHVSLEDKLQPTLARIECEMIKAALAQHRGRVDAVAKSLGISRKGLYLKRQRLGV